jgi:hypothetical protein
LFGCLTLDPYLEWVSRLPVLPSALELVGQMEFELVRLVLVKVGLGSVWVSVLFGRLRWQGLIGVL